jgi:Fe-S-cluster containining protein
VKNRYREILALADEHFAKVAAASANEMQCRKGCTLCCHGFFEITAADVAMVADGVASLPAAIRKKVVARASDAIVRTAHPDLRECDASTKERFFDRTEQEPCPALSDAGACLIYDARPLVCRTFGLPIRNGAQFLGEECELNFTTSSVDQREKAAWDLEWEDVIGEGDEFTVAEAIVLADRLAGR